MLFKFISGNVAKTRVEVKLKVSWNLRFKLVTDKLGTLVILNPPIWMTLMKAWSDTSSRGRVCCKTVAYMNANHGSSDDDDIKRYDIELDPD